MQSAFLCVATRLMANPLTGLAPLTQQRHLPGVLHPPSGRLQRRRDLRQTAIRLIRCPCDGGMLCPPMSSEIYT